MTYAIYEDDLQKIKITEFVFSQKSLGRLTPTHPQFRKES